MEPPRQAPPLASQSTGDASAPPEAAPEPPPAPDSARPEAATIRPAAPVEFDASYRYAINLESSRRAVPGSAPPDIEALAKFRLYTAQFVKGNTIWNRLRLGFFPTKKAAEEVRESLLKAYPGAWIAKVSLEETVRSAQRM